MGQKCTEMGAVLHDFCIETGPFRGHFCPFFLVISGGKVRALISGFPRARG